MQNAIIVDLDNTLFDSRCLEKYLPKNNTPQEWKEFNKHYGECVYNEFVKRACEKLAMPPTFSIVKLNNEFVTIFLTGRVAEGNVIKSTREQLDKLNIDYILIMRPPGNIMRARDLKEELYHSCIHGRYNVFGAFEDDPAVIELWKELGIPVLQAHLPYKTKEGKNAS